MTIRELGSWIQSHRDTFLDLIRIYLGVGLFIKGVFYLMHPGSIPVAPDTAIASFLPIVPWVHIVGGVLLALGVLTRLAALVQMPVIATALFAIHLPGWNDMAGREGVEFSALVLFLLLLIFVRGPGSFSLAHRWKAPFSLVPASWQKWEEEHSDLFLDLVRIYLGIGLFIKGIYIMTHSDAFVGALDRTGNLSLLMLVVAHYVIPAHLAGGFLLAIGALTRLAAFAQVPLLIGALFYVSLPRFATIEQRQNLEFTGLVLFLATLVTVYGFGRYSVDYLVRKYQPPEWRVQPAHS